MSTLFQLIALFSWVIWAVRCPASGQKTTFSVMYEWKSLDYNWPNNSMRDEAVQNGDFVKQHNGITIVKIWRMKMYVAIPRIRSGVPVTLATIPFNSLEALSTKKSPILNAYPTWDMQTVGDCNAFQFVQSIEIDTQGRLWILDTGHAYILENNKPKSCGARIVIVDLSKSAYSIVKTHKFPNEVASRENNYINDIVIDVNKNRYFAYITDLGEKPGIIVYSFDDNRSWKMSDPASMTYDPSIKSLTIDGTTIPEPILHLGNVDGIALSPVTDSKRRVFFCPLTGYRMYSVFADDLRNESLKDQIGSVIQFEGTKPSVTDGMIFDYFGRLYFGIIERNEVRVWNKNANQNFTKSNEVLAANNLTIRWADGFHINGGHLYVVTNNLQNVLVDADYMNQVNIRILRTFIGAESYLYPPLLHF